jgi:hypothetical protein
VIRFELIQVMQASTALQRSKTACPNTTYRSFALGAGTVWCERVLLECRQYHDVRSQQFPVADSVGCRDWTRPDLIRESRDWRWNQAIVVSRQPLSLALSQSIGAHQFGEPGLLSAPKLTDLYRTPSMST